MIILATSIQKGDKLCLAGVTVTVTETTPSYLDSTIVTYESGDGLFGAICFDDMYRVEVVRPDNGALFF